ncbi:Potassium voltage-gated channel subfamily H member 3 like, partial [Quillaja saponaria]
NDKPQNNVNVTSILKEKEPRVLRRWGPLIFFPLPWYPTPFFPSHQAKTNKLNHVTATTHSISDGTKPHYLEHLSSVFHCPLEINLCYTHSNARSTFFANCSLNQGIEGDKCPQNEEFKIDSVEMCSKLAKLGLAAVLAYRLFDGVTDASFFVLSFLGYEKSTMKNPIANLQALLGTYVTSLTCNNIIRTF